MSAARKSALELSVRAYITKRDGNVANPVIGTSFDSIDEAYNFYNLYSWEVGFGIRLSKSRLNVNRSRCMQEIVCGCAVSLCFAVLLVIPLHWIPRNLLVCIIF